MTSAVPSSHLSETIADLANHGPLRVFGSVVLVAAALAAIAGCIRIAELPRLDAPTIVTAQTGRYQINRTRIPDSDTGAIVSVTETIGPNLVGNKGNTINTGVAYVIRYDFERKVVQIDIQGTHPFSGDHAEYGFDQLGKDGKALLAEIQEHPQGRTSRDVWHLVEQVTTLNSFKEKQTHLETVKIDSQIGIELDAEKTGDSFHPAPQPLDNQNPLHHSALKFIQKAPKATNAL